MLPDYQKAISMQANITNPSAVVEYNRQVVEIPLRRADVLKKITGKEFVGFSRVHET